MFAKKHKKVTKSVKKNNEKNQIIFFLLNWSGSTKLHVGSKGCFCLVVESSHEFVIKRTILSSFLITILETDNWQRVRTI